MGNRQSAPTPSASAAAAGAGGPPESCPVNPKYRNPAVYNVYGQRINDPSVVASANPLQHIQGADVLDPKNNMPLEPNQLPCPGQRKPLSVDRVASNIPKGGTESTWLFPSPQMVFNALRRKGKDEDITEDDMDGFIAAHNSMNEATWQRVMLWESLHRTECDNPTLLRFQGRPHDLRRAGHGVAFEIVARPAVDTVDSALDRVKMNIYLKFAEWGLPCPITGHTGGVAAQPSQQQ
ncbi:Cytochrome c-type heme lyase [Tetrabaena socialis]|uniref:Holocytochrome c-type synthase n=1 Tax=Tetrabaena socialis TaxID=47790 RepID=A0A2J7ZUR5_9CHLO|nr:Cytochrome c-type heme lyase [Tetrabaena socialis]|eukprot:PNH04023.1 Cytochrome c-type heme lyase [Tetrabaena socialis]